MVNRFVQLKPGLVIVWLLDLGRIQLDFDYLLSLLTPVEVSKCEKFIFHKDKTRYIASHGILRILISQYLDLIPDSFDYVTNQYGKPYLPPQISGKKIYFNISHSYKKVIIGLSQERELGVDLEYVDPKFPTIEIAKRFFSQNEVGELFNLPAELQVEGFYKCWTQKEAYIKARGTGLSTPLDSFDVNVSPLEPAGLLASRDNPEEIRKWKIKEINFGSEYKSAICVEGNHWDLLCCEWT